MDEFLCSDSLSSQYYLDFKNIFTFIISETYNWEEIHKDDHLYPNLMSAPWYDQIYGDWGDDDTDDSEESWFKILVVLNLIKK